MITLVLGGARSGKSTVAERLVTRRLAQSPVPPAMTYVATLAVGDDRDLADRVAQHRARRPPAWATVEAGADLPAVLRGVAGVVLVDSLGPWVGSAPDMAVDASSLCEALVARDGDTVVVSEEVGLSVHPSTQAGRRFQDALGVVNQAVAACAQEVLLVVAGRTLRLDATADGP